MKRATKIKYVLLFIVSCLASNITYAITSTLYTSDCSTKTLHAISTVDASSTLIGEYGVTDACMSGLAYDSSSDVFYGVSGHLFQIDRTTGAATEVGPFGGDLFMSGMAYDPMTGNLYGAYGFGGEERFYTIDSMTGDATLIGDLSGYQVLGLAFDPVSNILYASAYTEPPGQASFMTINKDTGAVSLINNTTQPLTGIAFDPVTGLLYGVDSGTYSTFTRGLYQVDKTTGDTTLIGLLPLEAPFGLEFVAAVPIPPSFYLLGSGLLGLIGVSKRKKMA